MRVVDERIVHRNRSPNHRPEAISGVTLAWSRLGSSQPVLLCAFRSGSAKMSQDGRIALRSSKDLGRTWEDVPSPFAARPRDPWDQATRRVAGERAADQARAPHDPSLWGTM